MAAALTKHRLLQREYEQTALNECQQSVSLHEGLENILHHTTDLDGSPTPTIDCIKSNLDIERDFSKDIEKATEAYNVAVCRNIGPAMYKRLPRELRDMVYEYLTTSKLHTTSITAYLAVENSNTDILCPERYWRASVIGSEVAHELKESWYRNTTFRVDGNMSIKTLLDKDRFGIGLEPRDLINKLTRQISVVGFSTKDGNVQTLLNLCELFLLRTVTQLHVNVYISHVRTAVMEDMLWVVLRLIRSTILRLRESGYQCSVTVDERCMEGISPETIRNWEDDLEAEVNRGNSPALGGV